MIKTKEFVKINVLRIRFIPIVYANAKMDLIELMENVLNAHHKVHIVLYSILVLVLRE